MHFLNIITNKRSLADALSHEEPADHFCGDKGIQPSFLEK